MAQVLNKQAGLNRVGGNMTLYLKLLDVLTAGVEEGIEEMSAAMQARNLDDLAKAAHKLKGTAAGVDAEGVIEVMRRFEETIDADIDKYQRMLGELAEAQHALKGEIDQIKES